MTLKLDDPELLREANLIGGEWIGADSGETIDVTNPATGDVIGTVPKCGAAETKRAIDAAEKAMKEWAKELPETRARVLRRLFDLMGEHRDDLCRIMTAEQGKPLKESGSETDYAAGFIEWFSEEARRIYGDVIPRNSDGRRLLAIKQPVGVVAAITPWNFPSAMITRKAGPAWAVGCGVVVKPATATPFSALALGVLAERAGLPAGLCNIVTGSASDIGGEMTGNPTVRKISFTGSTEVGAKLYSDAAHTIKKVSLELGGNAPLLVFDDADLDAAVEGVMQAKFRNGGQACTAANRIFVQSGVYEEFADKLASKIRGLTVGNGMEDGVDVGPLIDPDAVDKVEEHIADAKEHGGRVVVGGERHEKGGTFFQPTLMVDVDHHAKVTHEETFGPFAPLFRFETEEEGLRLANDTRFGLASYFYARDIGRIFRIAEGLEAGMVGVNEGLISTPMAPFGGVKASGIGREGSKYGADEYLEIKYIALGGL